MTVTIIVEDGTIVADANSYISVADADAILALAVDPTVNWAALSDDDKAIRLIDATQWLDDHVVWNGKRVTDPVYPYPANWQYPLPAPTPGIPAFPPPSGTNVTATTPQVLGWPRRDVRDREGRMIANDIVPPQVKRLTVLYANYILNGEGEADILSGGLKRFKADNFEIEYQPGYFPTTAPPFIRFALWGLGQLAAEPGFKRIKRV